MINENMPGIYEPQYIYRQGETCEDGLLESDLAAWEELVGRGIKNALFGLSELLCHDINLNSLEVEQMPVNDILLLTGTSNTPGIGVCLSFTHDIDGQLMLLYTPETAFRFIDLMLDLPVGSTKTLGDMEWYALKDIGNITGSYFLNTLADNADIILLPSPPEVIVDSISEIMKIPMRSIVSNRKNAVLVRASFSDVDNKMNGTFIALPTTDIIKMVTKRLVTC